MKLIKILIISGCLVFLAFSGYARQLAGKNVILLHGFKPEHVFKAPPTDEGEADAKFYWLNDNDDDNNDYDHPLVFELAKEPNPALILHFPSSSTIQNSYTIPEVDGPTASFGRSINQIVAEQLKAIPYEFYENGCVIITHSTGDLVLRHIMAHPETLLGEDNTFFDHVDLIIDMAGAGGGTEGARILYDIANGLDVGSNVLNAFLKMIGVDEEDLHQGFHSGVLWDLQPTVARLTDTNNIPEIPRLRIVGTGADPGYGIFTKMFLLGKNDSVIPLHSACGAAKPEAYDSCSPDIRINGKVASVNRAPAPEELYDYHYPLIMSQKLAHNDMQKNIIGHTMTVILSSIDAYHDEFGDEDDIEEDYKCEKDGWCEDIYAWWDWFHKYRYITDAKEKSMGQVILDLFE